MRDTLQLALTDIVPPEQLDVLCEAVSLLETVGLSAPSDEIQTVIEIMDAMSDNTLMLARINDILFYAYQDALNSFGVTVIDEAPLAFKTALLDSLTSLDYYIIPEQIQMLYQAPFTSEEIVAHLLPIFSAFDLEYAMMNIHTVSDATITRLAEIIEAKVALRDPEDLRSPRDNTARVAKLNLLIKLVKPQGVSIVYELAQAGVRAGRPLNALLEQNLPALDGMTPEQVASELLALVVFSNEPLANLRTKTQQLCNDYEENVQTLRAMEMRLTQLCQSLEV